MNTSTRCQAKNRATCPRHGIPLHKQYKGDLQDVEAFLQHKEKENHETRTQQGIPTPLKNMNAKELENELREASTENDWLNEEQINSSIELAAILHQNQTRGNRGGFDNTPYIEHPLRNAVRLHRLGVKDNEVIVAAILHDTIEDGAQDYLKKIEGRENQPELEARETLSSHINKEYGTNTLRLVKAVTNDYLTDTDKATMSIEQKNRNYLRHVKASIKNDPEVLLVKISDFIDNATGLYHNNTPARKEKTYKQATKYLPVTDVFIEELETIQLPVSNKAQQKLINSMRITKTRLQQIIKTGENNDRQM